MEKYKKGKNVEEPLEKNQIPIKGLPDDFLWMQVNPGTKMRNVLEHAFEEMKSRSAVVWSGSGPAVGKVISCAEIMKRQHTLHQVNKICFRKIKEFWDPLIEDLDPLVVVRELPTIHILLSKEPVDTSQSGYQAPDKKSVRNYAQRQQNKPQRRRIESDKFESFGLRSTRTKNSRQKPNELRHYQKADTDQAEEAREELVQTEIRRKDTPREPKRKPQIDRPDKRRQTSDAGPSGIN